MKKILLIILLFISFASYSQVSQQFGAVADNLDSLHTHVGRQHQYVVILNVADSTGAMYYYDSSSLATEITNKVFKVTGRDTGRWFFVHYFNTFGSDSTTASNGLTLVGKDIRLGATTVGGSTLAHNTFIRANNFNFTIDSLRQLFFTADNSGGQPYIFMDTSSVQLTSKLAHLYVLDHDGSAPSSGASSGLGASNGVISSQIVVYAPFISLIRSGVSQPAKLYDAHVSDSLGASDSIRLAVWNKDTLKSAANLVYQNDTTAYKPVIINTSNNKIYKGSWVGSGGGGGSTLTRQIITSGTSGTVTGGNYIVTIDPSATLAAYTLTMPASPSDLQTVEVDFGGTVTSGTIVTALVISPNSGQTILDNTPPTTATADNTLFYRYRTSNTTWYRFKP